MSAPARTVLLVSAKRSAGNTIRAAWLSRFPKDRVLLFFVPPMGYFRFHLDRNIPISSLPMINFPRLEPRAPSELPAGGELDFGAAAAGADLIVCATDPDERGARNFLDLLEISKVDVPASEIIWLRLDVLTAMEVLRAIDTDLRISDPVFVRLGLRGRARQYFDYNYARNALPLFGYCLRGAGVPDQFNFLSKFALQLLLYLDRHQEDPLSQGDLMDLMRRGFGTGKNGPSPLGSLLSRSAILDFLIGAELLVSLDGTAGGRFVISPLSST